jgi:hypothetical protein
MDLLRIIYTSRPFGFDEAILNGILLDARRSNKRDEITGALICRDDIYIQLLEGPKEPVKRAVARIEDDDRHVEMTVRSEEAVSHRMFGEWAMLHDPAVSWIWSHQEVADGAVDRATTSEVEGFFLRLRELVSAPDGG